MTGPPASAPAAIELQALLCYLTLAAFSRAAADAELAPDLAARSAMSRLAARHYRQHELLVARLRLAGADPQACMATFVPPVDAFHARTVPSDWPEALLKSFIGVGVAADFARQAAVPSIEERSPNVAPPTPEAPRPNAEQDFLAEALRAELDADPTIAGRLALWGRRVVGEGLSQAQRVAADRPDLADLVSSDVETGAGEAEAGSSALTRVSALLLSLTNGYQQRVTALGLTP